MVSRLAGHANRSTISSTAAFESREHRLWLPVGIGGDIFSGLLDTGSDGTVVDASVAARIGLEIADRVAGSTVADTFQVERGGPVAFQLGENELRAEAVGVLPIATQLQGLDVILGFDVLRCLAFTIDYRRGTISWGEMPPGPQVPFVAADDIRPTVPMKVLGHAVTGTVDTGSARGISLPAAWLNRHGGLDPGSGEKRSVLGATVTAGSFQLDTATVAGHDLEGVPGEAVNAEAGSFADQDTPWANLGNLVLERFQIGVDGAGRVTVWQPAGG